MIITIKNPETLEVIQILDDHDYACPALEEGSLSMKHVGDVWGA